MFCPYCGKKASFLTTKEFYGKDYGSNIYSCRDCNAYVGTYGNTHKPLGTMAKKELRRLRKIAHSVFDPIWKKEKATRTEMYEWLQRKMKLSQEDAHIGRFNEEQCKRLIAYIKGKDFKY